MTIIILLIGISLCIAVVFLVVFVWSVRDGQYDDTYTPSVRMLFDDGKKPQSKDQAGSGKTGKSPGKSDDQQFKAHKTSADKTSADKNQPHD
jgi:cbb3-type cytochrome oxidase maturation protein